MTIDHNGLIVIGENFNTSRKIKGSSPRVVNEGEKYFLTYTDLDGWNFPVGTIIIKEFTIHSVVNDPTSEVIPMETRFMIRNESADWTVASYKWNPDGTEGFLRDDIAETEQWTVYDAQAAQDVERSDGQRRRAHGAATAHLWQTAVDGR